MWVWLWRLTIHVKRASACSLTLVVGDVAEVKAYTLEVETGSNKTSNKIARKEKKRVLMKAIGGGQDWRSQVNGSMHSCLQGSTTLLSKSYGAFHGRWTRLEKPSQWEQAYMPPNQFNH
ncbi:hypothetical protein NE237_028898 [Protea cynaroides]|uniref:Secreted protein n=1 Tax=Protea cynaroides TaxID=273540 RepID=A0A9Q0JU97_9MAGN|nr:hypothetical protein NE237_028898 [Protea cynaroides]